MGCCEGGRPRSSGRVGEEESYETHKAYKIDVTLDLRGEVCPYTFVKTKLTLEEMEEGSILEVLLDYPPAVENVSKSVRIEGNEVLERLRLNEREWRLVIRRGMIRE